MTVATAVRDLHDEGNSVAEIAFTLGLTTFEVRAVINRHDPPDRGQALLIPPPPNPRHSLSFDGSVYDLRVDPADNKRPVGDVAELTTAPGYRRGPYRPSTRNYYPTPRKARETA